MCDLLCGLLGCYPPRSSQRYRCCHTIPVELFCLPLHLCVQRDYPHLHLWHSRHSLRRAGGDLTTLQDEKTSNTVVVAGIGMTSGKVVVIGTMMVPVIATVTAIMMDTTPATMTAMVPVIVTVIMTVNMTQRLPQERS
uniref:Uncharacterized protein n=1 Tax=Pyramimonas obovata TaxID=1411642 RepID=A0A7S0RBE7_9CHLO